MEQFGTAILLALAAMLANGEYLFGSSMLSRPLVTCTLAGLIMGDVQMGIIMGATLELAFVGSFSIGASIPPEIISGSYTRNSLCDFDWREHSGSISTWNSDCFPCTCR